MEFEPDREIGFLDLALKRALVCQKQIFRQLLRDRRAALHHGGRARIDSQRTERADDVDAPMLVEAAIFGGEHCLDEIFRQLIERDVIVVPDAAAADLVAIAIEEGDGEILLLQPIVGGFLESRNRQDRASMAPPRPSVELSQANSSRSRRQPWTWNRSMKAEKLA